jgi:ATP-dependent protease ClpP protease subunit
MREINHMPLVQMDLHPNLRHKSGDDVLVTPPQILYVQEFDEKLLPQTHGTINAALKTGQTFLPIVIDSPGGRVHTLLGMLDLLDASKLQIVTVVSGKAMSCGALLSCLGTVGHRYIAPTASLMHHEVSSGALGKSSELEASVEEVKRLSTILADRVSKHCGHKKGWYEKRLHDQKHADWYLDPRTAVALGFADHVGIPTFHVKIDVQYSLEK